MSTRELIDAIQSGNATDVAAAFNSAMTDKVSEKLDAMRTDMAQNMFGSKEETSEENTEE
jgi:hypothetical protein